MSETSYDSVVLGRSPVRVKSAIARQQLRQIRILFPIVGVLILCLMGLRTVHHGYPDAFLRLFYTAEDLVEWRADEAMLSHVITKKFTVMCPAPDISAADRARFVAFAQNKGLTPYPASGPDCVDP